MRVNGGPVVQVAGDEDGVGFLFENLTNHPSQKAAVAHMTKVDVADQRRFASAPDVRQIFQVDPRMRDARPTRVENSQQAQRRTQCETRHRNAMELELRAGDSGYPENDPKQHRRQKKETQKAHPDGGGTIERPYDDVGVTESEE